MEYAFDHRERWKHHMRLMELRGRKGRRDAENRGAGCTSGRDPGWRILNDDALAGGSAEAFRGKKVCVGSWLSALNILGADENGGSSEADRGKPEFCQSPTSRCHDGSAFGGNRVKQWVGSGQYRESLGIRGLNRLEPTDFGFRVELWSDVADGLNGSTPVGATNEVGNVEPMPREPTIPCPLDNLLGIDEDAIEIEQDCPAMKDLLRQRSLGGSAGERSRYET